MMFLFVAAFWGVVMIAGMSTPGLSVSCDAPQPCHGKSDPMTLLGDEERDVIAHDPAARMRLDAWIARPGVRVGLAGLVLLGFSPVIWLFVAVGLALRRLGERRDDVLARALPWLKQGSRAAIALTIARLLEPSLKSALLSPGTAHLRFPIDLNDMILPLLLAFAAYATAWALEAGIQAQRDLADFV